MVLKLEYGNSTTKKVSCGRKVLMKMVANTVLGNILAITPSDTAQVAIIGVVTIFALLLTWRDLMVTFFDENHARAVGLNTALLKFLFFTLLSASTVAALQTVGAFLVIAMVVTPGATAYLLTDKFSKLIIISILIGTLASLCGSYISYFLDGATGGIIVVIQSLCFGLAFVLGPKHGLLARKRQITREAVNLNEVDDCA